MVKKIFIVLFSLPFGLLWGQILQSPLEKCNFEKPTSYTELSEYVHQLDQQSPILELESIGQSMQRRNIYAMKYSTTGFGKDKSKLKVMLFAQQHGNEQSGKEGALLLAEWLLQPENHYLFDKLDIAIVPQVNPDGSEANRRRNGNDADLNRNHLIMTEPEVISLHRFFDQYLFEVTMDTHEYAPYFSETWKKYGYRCNSDELIGCNTNPNISQEIRDLSNNSFIPFWRNYLKKEKFTSSIYAPGGPPEIDYIRHSTFDINDGRQSFGIQNCFSLIQEGLNGYDTFKDSLRRRAVGQMTGMRAVLEFSYQKHKQLKELVAKERHAAETVAPETVAIQLEHVKTGKQHELPVYSYATGHDSIILVKDYRPLVKSIYDVKKPEGYLIPKSCTELVEWSKRQTLKTSVFKPSKKFKLIQYEIITIDSIDFEGDMTVNPNMKTLEIKDINPVDYVFVPTSQLKSNLVVIALEPKSELGLVTYHLYSHLLKANSKFPVLRVEKNTNNNISVK
jgi:hypothetical protein